MVRSIKKIDSVKIEKNGVLVIYFIFALDSFFLRERSLLWGKNLKGKECGKGIFQRKDSLYLRKIFMLKMVRVKIDISKRCQKQKNAYFLKWQHILIV